MAATSLVADYYLKKNVLITGGTGFMGKVLVEKLLRSCPGISTIYLIVRSKKGRKPNERLDDIINCPVIFF